MSMDTDKKGEKWYSIHQRRMVLLSLVIRPLIKLLISALSMNIIVIGCPTNQAL